MPVDDSHPDRPAGQMAGRQPPRFVPTLTDVVSAPGREVETPTRVSQTLPPKTQGSGDLAAEADVTMGGVKGQFSNAEVQVERILHRLVEELEPRLADCVDRQTQIIRRELVTQLLSACMKELEPQLLEAVKKIMDDVESFDTNMGQP